MTNLFKTEHKNIHLVPPIVLDVINKCDPNLKNRNEYYAYLDRLEAMRDVINAKLNTLPEYNKKQLFKK